MKSDIEGGSIHAYVRQRYEKAALQDVSIAGDLGCCAPGQSCCCGPAGDLTPEQLAGVKQLYETPDVLELPQEVTGISLGCGDPVTLAALQPGQTVLDLGSGGGIDCFLAAKRVGPGGRVIGVDMTPAMIDRARANKEKLGAENVEFRLGEIEHLPAADGTVDVILSNCVINLSPDKPQVFREAFRVLKPGGKLAVSDIVTRGPLPEAVKADLAAWAGCVSGALDESEFAALLEAAGFVGITLTPTALPREVIDEAVAQLEEADLSGLPEADVYQAVFSAKITARKPA